MSLATLPHPVPPRTALAELTARAAVVPLTLDQYQRMIEEGILPQDRSVELLSGVLVRKDRSVIGEDPMGHSPLHVLVVSLLSALVSRINNERRHLKVQLPIACPPNGAPEPDAAIVRGTPRDYLDRLPGAGEVFCVIEAAHSSLERDRDDKLPTYAAGGIPQYLIINLRTSTIEVHTDPDPAAGLYGTKITLAREQTVRLNLGEGEWLEVRAEELLP